MTKKQKKGKPTEFRGTVEVGRQMEKDSKKIDTAQNVIEQNKEVLLTGTENSPAGQTICAVCKNPGDKSCGSCKAVHYCSVEHQKEHWKIHKDSCTPFLIVDLPGLLGDCVHQNKQWIASRNLKAGTIVLEEKPVIFSPQWTESEIHGIPNCLTCGIYMQKGKNRRCRVCRWPTCSDECSQHPIHALYECQVFSDRKISFPLVNSGFSPDDLCAAILCLRGVALKKENEEQYNSTMVTFQPRFLEPLYNKTLNEEVDELISKLRSLIGPTLEEDEENCRKIVRVKKVNAFTGHLYPNIINTSRSDVIPSCGLYVVAAKANHSCVPNISWSVGGLLPPDLRLRIRTTVDVKKGQVLTLSYRPSDSHLGTSDRQRALRTIYGFTCKCPRCLDPTECQTFVSAITCQECLVKTDKPGANFGYFLPDDPLNLEPNALWRCNNCKVTHQGQDLHSIVSSIEDRFQSQKKVFSQKQADPTIKMEFYENFLKENRNQLHRNHWIFQKVTMEIIVCHRAVKNVMNKMELESCVQYFEFRLNIQDKTTPGLSAERAMTFRYMKDVLLTLLSRFHTKMEGNEVQHWADYSKGVLNEALHFYRLDINPMHIMQKGKPITDILEQDLLNLEKNLTSSLLMSARKSNKNK